MARANTTTWLPLDRWAEIMGIHPFHFNGLSSSTYLSQISCGTPWYQFAWQNSDRLGREDIAYAIRSAERRIADEVNYHLIPDWIKTENIRYARPAVPELYSATGRNVRGQFNSLTTRYGKILSGGQRAKVGIETVDVTRTDEDGDGYSETVTITVATSVEDADELKVYLPGKSGNDKYEVRPIEIDLDTDANSATITCKSWQIVDPDLQELVNVGESSQAIDAEAAASYVTTLDVYRVYNDPQTQVSFIWEQSGSDLWLGTCCGTCTACQLNTQTGCFHTRDERLGMIVPAPGTWDAANQQFTSQCWSTCRGPDRASISYYSGNRDFNLDRPKSEMEPFWEYAVAYYAASLLDKGGCDCSNAMDFINHWRDNRAMAVEERTYVLSPGQLNNKLGTTNGALYAWNCINEEGRKIGR
jgi:hypothetical protein